LISQGQALVSKFLIYATFNYHRARYFTFVTVRCAHSLIIVVREKPRRFRRGPPIMPSVFAGSNYFLPPAKKFSKSGLRGRGVTDTTGAVFTGSDSVSSWVVRSFKA
jgi:hypothetical protein